MSLEDYITQKPILETDRLILRTLLPTDVPALREWMPNKDMYKYWGKAPGKTDKNPELMFVTKEKQTKSLHLGIINKGDSKAIGEIWVYLIENNRMAKVAFHVSNKYQGKGYATEALNTIIMFCFSHTELQRLWTDVDIHNIPSCHVLENCGFQKEGLIRQGKMVSSYCDYYIYGMLREDFKYFEA